MNKGTLILICGLIGAGKTTLAKKLAVERSANRLCADDWILAILKDKEDTMEMDRLRNPVEQLLWNEAQEILKLGTNVILENGFWAKKERNIYRDTARNMGVPVELHFVSAPLEIAWERVSKRNSNPNEFQITKQQLENAYKVFQPPTNEEGSTYDYFKKY